MVCMLPKRQSLPVPPPVTPQTKKRGRPPGSKNKKTTTNGTSPLTRRQQAQADLQNSPESRSSVYSTVITPMGTPPQSPSPPASVLTMSTHHNSSPPPTTPRTPSSSVHVPPWRSRRNPTNSGMIAAIQEAPTASSSVDSTMTTPVGRPPQSPSPLASVLSTHHNSLPPPNSQRTPSSSVHVAPWRSRRNPTSSGMIAAIEEAPTARPLLTVKAEATAEVMVTGEIAEAKFAKLGRLSMKEMEISGKVQKITEKVIALTEQMKVLDGLMDRDSLDPASMDSQGKHLPSKLKAIGENKVLFCQKRKQLSAFNQEKGKLEAEHLHIQYQKRDLMPHST